jgi:2-polyprenyl-3-methyl-5-hydroxy-6-metoxy-1,4-benzoquinol methylase
LSHEEIDLKVFGFPNIIEKSASRPLGTLHGPSAVIFRPLGWLSRLLPHPHIRTTKEKWETQYSSGWWDYLGQIDQLARYSVIAGYSHYLKPGGSVLDVGCGEGILQEKMRAYGYSRYDGMDLSAEAIARASSRRDEKTNFIAADAETYNPECSYDVIVLNECLYYVQDPIGMMRRFESFLNAKGVFVVSMYVSEITIGLWKKIEGVYAVADEIRMAHRSGNAWTIKVLTPGGETCSGSA